ncbi:MAG: ABC transporter permease [Ardenticatenaceae bacterium]|nr:ABC transporter permease [Ardenticatenaceae bacterium]MCB9443495.1 ABC transporter permease [Ardenticatenaceae bacterium]
MNDQHKSIDIIKLQEKLVETFTAGSRPVLSIIMAFFVSGVIIYLQGINPVEAYAAVWRGAFGSLVAFGNTCVRTTPLLLGALGMTLGIRGGHFNVGGEGQLYIGAAAATAVALIPFPVPGWLHVLLAMIAGILGGTFWAVLPAFLRAYRGISEIVVTIMLNFVGIYLVSYFVHEPTLLAKEGASYAQSREILDTAVLPIMVKGTSMHYGIVIAVILGILLQFVLRRTAFGFRTRMVGTNPEASYYAGIKVKASLFATLLIVGGFYGLMGTVEILGLKHSLYDNFSGGLGYETIAVALMGGANPIGVIFSAFFFGGLKAGGNLMQQTVGIPSSMVQVIQALAVLFVVGFGVVTPKPAKRNKKVFQTVTPSKVREEIGNG